MLLLSMDAFVSLAIYRRTATLTEANWNCVLLEDPTHVPKRCRSSFNVCTN